MTAILCTVTADAAWLSADSFVSLGGSMHPPATGGLAAAAFPAEPFTPSARQVTSAQKIFSATGRRFAVAGAGWAGAVFCAVHTALPQSSFDNLIDQAAPMLRDIRAGHGARGAYLLVAAGWSERHGRALGAVFMPENGFEPTLLDQGHTLQPGTLDTAASAGYPELVKLWGQAIEGRQVCEFHRAVLDNQAQTWRRGGYGDVGGIGGRGHGVRIDAADITDYELGQIA